MNIALAAFGGYPASTWESEEGAHTPSGSKTPIVICGWLLKMKREHRKFRSTWNRRWFTVEDGAFHWYKTSSSDACGRLCLEDIKSVRRYVGTEHGSYTFVVHATDREMLLRAESANDEGRWIRGLTLQTDLVHGGTFMGPPSAKNRRRTVLKLMGENCGSGGGGSGSDGRGETQNGGCNSGGEGWKAGEGSQFREINNRIRAIMNDQEGGGAGRGSATGVAGGKNPTRYYSDQLPIQKSKITPRDPRGISIVGGRGLGKFPGKDDGSHPIELGGGGNGNGNGGSGARRFSYTTSKVVPIATPASPGSCSPEETPRGGGSGGGGVSSDHLYEAQNISSARTDQSSSDGSVDIGCRGRSCSSSTDDGRWPVVNGVGVSRDRGRPRPPMPSAPPPANARGRGVVKGGSASKNDAGEQRGGDGGDGDAPRGKGRQRRSSKQHRHSRGGGGRKSNGASRGQARKNGAGGAGPRGRRDRQQFGDLADCSSSRTRGDPFMDEYISGETPRGVSNRSSPASVPKAATSTSSNNKKGRRRRRRPHRRHQHTSTEDSNDASRASDSSSSPTTTTTPPPRLQAAGQGGGSQRRSERNFDNDDCSREDDVPIERDNFWLRAGYAEDNGASPGYGGGNGGGRCNAGGGGGGGGSRSGGGASGTGSGCNSRGGSATAEDVSWNTGMMGGSSSRSAGSSRGGSGRGPPRRRYLVEQNEFRQQGW
eukprot:g11124.t1